MLAFLPLPLVLVLLGPIPGLRSVLLELVHVASGFYVSKLATLCTELVPVRALWGHMALICTTTAYDIGHTPCLWLCRCRHHSPIGDAPVDLAVDRPLQYSICHHAWAD